MNCKPGDLAIVVRSSYSPEAVGSIVRCLRMEPDPETLEPAWRLDRAIGKRIFADGCWRQPDWAYDKNLRPIRPGDISDEEVRDLYAPKIPEAA